MFEIMDIEKAAQLLLETVCMELSIPNKEFSTAVWIKYFELNGPLLPEMVSHIVRADNLSVQTGIDIMLLVGILGKRSVNTICFCEEFWGNSLVLDVLSLREVYYINQRNSHDPFFKSCEIIPEDFDPMLFYDFLQTFSNVIPMSFLSKHAEKLLVDENSYIIPRYIPLSAEFIDQHADFFVGDGRWTNLTNCDQDLPLWLVEKHLDKVCFDSLHWQKSRRLYAKPYINAEFFKKHVVNYPQLWRSVGFYDVSLEYLMENLDMMRKYRDVYNETSGVYRTGSSWNSVFESGSPFIPLKRLRKLFFKNEFLIVNLQELVEHVQIPFSFVKDILEYVNNEKNEQVKTIKCNILRYQDCITDDKILTELFPLGLTGPEKKSLALNFNITPQITEKFKLKFQSVCKHMQLVPKHFDWIRQKLENENQKIKMGDLLHDYEKRPVPTHIWEYVYDNLQFFKNDENDDQIFDYFEYFVSLEPKKPIRDARPDIWEAYLKCKTSPNWLTELYKELGYRDD